MKIAITGASGFIGGNLKDFLCSKNYNLKVLGRAGEFDEYLDLRKKNTIKKINLKNVDIFIHCASLSVNEFFRKKKVNKKNILNNIYYELNSLHEILKKCKKYNIKRFIFLSSAFVYGKNKFNNPFKTGQVIHPTDLYGSTKYAMEILGKKIFKNFISLRLFGVYGPNGIKDGVIPNVIKNKKILLGDCLQVVDMIYYKDLNFLIEKIINSSKICRGAFNVGSGKPTILKNVVKKIIKIKGDGTIAKFKKTKIDKIPNFQYADIKDLKKKLNWKPLYNLNRGLKELINEQ